MSEPQKRARMTRKQAQEEGRQEFPCSQCNRNYMSYSSRATHIKQKHPQVRPEGRPGAPEHQEAPQRVEQILENRFGTRQDQIEMKLWNIITFARFQLAKLLSAKGLIDIKEDVGASATENFLQQTVWEAKLQAENFMIPEVILQEYEKGATWSEYEGRVVPLSFGNDLVCYFARKRTIAVKVYLSLIVLEATSFKTLSGEDSEVIWGRLWGQNSDIVGCLREKWTEWMNEDKERAGEEERETFQISHPEESL